MSKNFEQLFEELAEKIKSKDEKSSTYKLYKKGVHSIGKKVVEEAAEVWMAAEYESKDELAEEISQLIYHLQVMMLEKKLSLKDIYKYL